MHASDGEIEFFQSSGCGEDGLEAEVLDAFAHGFGGQDVFVIGEVECFRCKVDIGGVHAVHSADDPFDSSGTGSAVHAFDLSLYCLHS